MSKKIALLLATVSLTIYSSAGFASELGYEPGELIVRFAPKSDDTQRSVAERNAILESFDGGEVKHTFKLVPGLSVVELPEDVTVEDAAAKLNKAQGILYAEPNYRVKALSMFPDDTYFQQQWGMHNTGESFGTKDADIDAPETWDIATSNSEIIVAVIDTGVDYNHIDLAGNMWVNPGEIPGNDIDDDNNGYVDDVYGYDFCTYHGHQRDSDPMDDNGHGTACAGIVGAIGNNNEGVAGVCWNVKIMALKFLYYTGYGNTDDAIASIEYAVVMGAKVLSNSWSSPEDPNGLHDTVQAACANGVLFVAASGNDDGPVAYPARYSETIAVGATDESDYRWGYSNYGDGLNVMAPSSYGWPFAPFWSTDITGSAGNNPGGSTTKGDVAGNYYKWCGGTSAAAPQVAGLAALILSVNPFLTSDEVQSIIESTADDKGDPGWDQYYGYGRINVHNALIKAGKWPGLLAKTDNLDPNDSVSPADSVTYTISFENNLKDPNDPNLPLGTLTNVTIVDYLPEEVDFNSADSNGVYDPNSRTVTWNIGTVEPNDSNSVTLTVTVNGLAEPLGTIINICIIDANEIPPVTAVETTDVNAWVPDVTYADGDKKYLTGHRHDTGMSWENAYIDLQDALEKAVAGCAKEIWVAAANEPYIPTTESSSGYCLSEAFELVNGVAVYGGFAGTETTLSQRNPADPNNETILTGDTDDDGDADVCYVVKAVDVNETAVIDGFTITKGAEGGVYCYHDSPTIRNNKITGNDSENGGIYCHNSDPNIINCTIEDNNPYGIRCVGSDPNIINCVIEDNTGDGIYCPTSSSPVITNSIIRSNGQNGIYCYEGTPVIKNNFISGDDGSSTDYGIYLEYPEIESVVRNNTVVYNVGYGIRLRPYTNEEPPPVSNCILWGENPLYEAGYDVTYSCVEGGYDGEGNISTDPCFVDDANDDYHLEYDSPCEDAGDPNFRDANETDIDGQPRNMGDCNETVDIGADEVYFPSCWNCPTQCHGDSDCSGFVSTADWPPFRDGFAKSYPDPDYIENACGDWNRDGAIGTADFSEYRDWFAKSPPADCNCGGVWPPGSCEGGEGRGQSSGDTADDSSLEDMINWIIQHDLPGSEEFLRRLYELL